MPVCMECTMRGFRKFSGNVCPKPCTIENNKFIQRPEARSESRGCCCFPPATGPGNMPPGRDDLLVIVGEHARAGAA